MSSGTKKQILLTLFVLIVLIISGCKTKEESFSTYISEAEEKVYKYVKDPHRAEQVIAEYHELEQLFIQVKPEYRLLIETKRQLDHASIHDEAGYRTLYDDLDTLNDNIRKELFTITGDFRSHLKEKEWKKLRDANFLSTFIRYLEEGV